MVVPVSSSKRRAECRVAADFFPGALPDKEIIENLKRVRNNTEANIDGLSSLKIKSGLFVQNEKPSRINYFFNKTLQLGIRTAELNLRWFDELIRDIEEKKSPSE